MFSVLEGWYDTAKQKFNGFSVSFYGFRGDCCQTKALFELQDLVKK